MSQEMKCLTLIFPNLTSSILLDWGGMGAGSVLYDHRSLQLNEDDYQRNNKVEWDPDVERVKLLGEALVPDYAMSFTGDPLVAYRDETVPTVVTRAEPHNQVVLTSAILSQFMELIVLSHPDALSFILMFLPDHNTSSTKVECSRFVKMQGSKVS
ncbi:hypothetical protein HAX54_019844 [Datura stramonium]|uniref:Uncharacterized protein n=1 Tax=Datura stramonium TaxID=4076 RepID=A0ABS8UPX8_DATST|nr:hypothetical protein [Datura stramonium]